MEDSIGMEGLEFWFFLDFVRSAHRQNALVQNTIRQLQQYLDLRNDFCCHQAYWLCLTDILIFMQASSCRDACILAGLHAGTLS